MAKHTRDLQTLAQLCHILGDKTRLRILKTLQDGEFNVTALCKGLKLPQPTVSRHLAILRMAGLVDNRRAGKEIYYSLSDYRNTAAVSGLKTLLGGSTAIRIGPVVVGLAKK
ncbi:MAG: metalloregulator ArsR/SmtB family transcription factor [Phycisphaerae bacterium]